MDTRRLRYVDDICPLYRTGALPSFEATRWAAEAGQSPSRVTYHPNGFTATVFRNPFFSWFRTFTTDNRPVRNPSSSFIHIEEWVPSFENALSAEGWINFGIGRRHGIAEVPQTGPLEKNWSTHAKRHLKTFRKQTEVTIRKGALEELEKSYAQSHIHAAMRGSLWRLTARHVRDHKETVDVFIAETKRDGVVAAFVAGNCLEASTSIYLLGFYLPPAEKTYAMTGLVARWFEEIRNQGLTLANFGDMCGPNPLPFSSDRGYSLFKTHFGIKRVNLPRSYWRISLKRN